MSNKAIFLDRDDTLIEDPGYISHPDQVKLLECVPEALIELKAMGYKIVVVSNQSAVARGIVSEEVLADIQRRDEIDHDNMRPAEDAIVIVTDNLSVPQVLEVICSYLEEPV